MCIERSLEDANEGKTIHVQNLQKLIIEVYKSLNHENASFLWDLLEQLQNMHITFAGQLQTTTPSQVNLRS